MLKRIISIALFTGAGQLFSIFALKYVSQHGSIEQLKAIAQIDSLILFIMNVIALGLQSASMRDLALSSDWKKDYSQAQSARITLSLLLMLLALLTFINNFYLLFLVAPVLAWSGDYALYARGQAVSGAIIAFIRLLIPFSLIILAAKFQPGHIVITYVVSVVLVYITTNLFISFLLKTSYFFRADIKNLHLYIKSLPLGIVVLSLYFLGLGLILVIPYFYSNAVVAATFIGLKFYVLFKGVLRIIHQAFIREMVSYEVCFKVDQLAGLVGLAFATFNICFPDTFIGLFFGTKFLVDKNYFMLLSVAAFIYSFFSSFIIKAMLEKKDILYAWVSSVAALLTILLSIIFSFIWPKAFAVALSLIVGEIVFATSMLAIMSGKKLLRERMLFFLKNVLVVLIPWLVSYFLGDKMVPFIIALSLFITTFAFLYFRRFTIAITD